MHFITLDGETDFDGWRNAARALALTRCEAGRRDLAGARQRARIVRTDGASSPEPPHGSTFNVSGKFIELAQTAILHRNAERFALLYRLLWRLRSDHNLLDIATDLDVAEVASMAKAVRRDEHKMHAFVQFREVGREQHAHYVAWFEPEHHIVELAAPSSRAASPPCRGRS